VLKQRETAKRGGKGGGGGSGAGRKPEKDKSRRDRKRHILGSEEDEYATPWPQGEALTYRCRKSSSGVNEKKKSSEEKNRGLQQSPAQATSAADACRMLRKIETLKKRLKSMKRMVVDVEQKLLKNKGKTWLAQNKEGQKRDGQGVSSTSNLEVVMNGTPCCAGTTSNGRYQGRKKEEGKKN